MHIYRRKTRNSAIAAVFVAIVVGTLGLIPVPVSAQQPESQCITICGGDDSGLDSNENEQSGSGYADNKKKQIRSQTSYSSESEPQKSVSSKRAPDWLSQCTWTKTNNADDPPEGIFPESGIGGQGYEIKDDGEFYNGTANKPAPGEGTDVWIMKCDASVVAAGATDHHVTIFPVGDPPPPSVIDAVIAQSYQHAPVISMYPIGAPAGSVDVPFATRLPTWLWVDDQDWQPVTATATNPVFSVTTTATPIETVWTGGHDPETLRCGQGKPYDFNIPEDDQDTDCQMAWHHSTSVGEQTLTVETIWETEFTCTDFCEGGNLPNITTTATRTVQVNEVKAILTQPPNQNNQNNQNQPKPLNPNPN